MPVAWRSQFHEEVNTPRAAFGVTPQGGRCLWPGEASSTASLDKAFHAGSVAG